MSDLKQRIFEIAGEMQLLSFATVTEDGKPWVRYVEGKADNELVFRFCTHIETRKVPQIRTNPSVHITMGVKDLETAENWLQVSGTAEISTEKGERHAFWHDTLANYFSGPDDPDYCIVVVRPDRIELASMTSMTPEVWEPDN